ncbi:MAG: hypothetical protein GY938_20580 [Ketobacter sp.]|nr:hypothetical protein [Ketobacter sp.]
MPLRLYRSKLFFTLDARTLKELLLAALEEIHRGTPETFKFPDPRRPDQEWTLDEVADQDENLPQEQKHWILELGTKEQELLTPTGKRHRLD